MRKAFLQHNQGAKVAGIAAVGFSVLFFVWATKDISGIRSGMRDMLTPIFRLSGFLGNFLSSSSSIEALENSKKDLEVKNFLLDSRVSELESLLSVPSENRNKGVQGLLVSQFPISPYSTITVEPISMSRVSSGMKAIAYGGIYIGNIMDAGENLASIKLLSFPELETNAWLERLSLNITIVGVGSNNMKFELPKDIKIEVGDRIISNTTSQYLIGEIEIIDNRPTEPLQEIRFRHPINFRNLRYVELF